MRIEGSAVGRGLFAIMCGAILQPFAWMSGMGLFATALCWLVIAVGIFGVYYTGKITTPGELAPVSWVAADDVPDEWEGRLVWHHVEARGRQKQLAPYTCVFSRLRFPKDQDGTGVYFALADIPEPPRKTGDAQ